MILKLIKWMFITLLVFVGSAIVLLGIGSRTSLDSNFNHTRETGELPLFPGTTESGLTRISANGFEFRARISGFETNAERPAVILLHGFPVTSAMWLDLIDPLVDAGFRVIAYDQRGYSPGARPDDLQQYVVPELTRDVFAVADAAGIQNFHLVGHDWGAVVGWSSVLTNPGRILSWSGLSIAHPTAFGNALQNDPDQRARSSYFLFFQIPWLSEAVFSFNDFSVLQGFYAEMSAIKRAEYLSVFSEPGALTGGLNWYRAINMNEGPSDVQSNNVQSNDVAIPTLFIWGNNDGAVGRVAIESQAQYMTGPYKEIELVAGHWLFADQKQRVVAEIVEHVSTQY